MNSARGLLPVSVRAVEFVCIVSAHGRFHYIRPSVEAALGYRNDELVGSLLVDLVHPEDRPSVLSAHFALLDGDRSAEQEIRIRLRHKNGSWRHFEGGARDLLHHPSVRGIMVNGRDVTPWLDSQRARGESETRFRRFVETTREGVIAMDTVGTITYANQRTGAILGLQPESLVGRLFFDFLTADAAFAVRTRYWQLDRHQSEDVEAQMQRPDGTLIDVRAAESPIFNEIGEFVGVLAMLSDTTQRRKTERALVEALREADCASDAFHLREEQLSEQLLQAQKMDSVGRLAGGAVHDFNNLLTIISAHCEFVLDSLDAGAPQRGDMETIRTTGARAAALARQLLAFSRRQAVVPQVIDLNAIVDETIGMLRRLLGEDVEVVMSLGSPLHDVRADMGQIGQVLVNLAVNARDAMPSGGRLMISTENVSVGPGPHASPDMMPPGDYVALSVSDTGSGMDSTVQARLFEPFFTTKDPGKGTGLGLLTVLGIVRQSSGYVTVESTPGTGSSFRLYFPAVTVAKGDEQS